MDKGISTGITDKVLRVILEEKEKRRMQKQEVCEKKEVGNVSTKYIDYY